VNCSSLDGAALRQLALAIGAAEHQACFYDVGENQNGFGLARDCLRKGLGSVEDPKCLVGVRIEVSGGARSRAIAGCERDGQSADGCRAKREKNGSNVCHGCDSFLLILDGGSFVALLTSAQGLAHAGYTVYQRQRRQ